MPSPGDDEPQAGEPGEEPGASLEAKGLEAEPARRRPTLTRRALRFLGRLLAGLAWLVVTLLAILVSGAYHLELPLAGHAAVEVVRSVLNNEIRGELVLGSLQNVSYEKFVARDVVVRDPQGREVIRIDRLAAWPDWSALLTGRIHFDRATARGGEVTLYVSGPDDGTVSLVEAFELNEPSPPTDIIDPDPIRVVVDGIDIEGVRLSGDVPGYPGLAAEDLRVLGRVESDSSLRFIVFDGSGVMTGPYPGRTQVEGIAGRYDIDQRVGLDFYARGRRGDDHVRARVRLRLPEGAPEGSTQELDVRAALEPLSMATVAELEIAPGLDSLSGTYRGHARLFGPTDDLLLRAHLDGEPGEVHLRGHLPSTGPMTFDAWTAGPLELSALVPAAPAMALDGRAQLTLEDPPEGSEVPVRRLHAELANLSVVDVAVPAFVVDGLLEEDAFVVSELLADHAGGVTRGRGRVGFDGSLDVHVSTQLPEISREANVRRFAPDARGSLRAELDVTAGPLLEDLALEGRASLRRARYGTVRAATLNARGRVAHLGPSPTLSVRADATGLQIGDLVLGEAEVGLTGAHGRYEVVARARDERTGTRVALSGDAAMSAERLRLTTRSLALDLGPGDELSGNVDVTLRPGRSIEVGELVLGRGDERLTVRGTYRFNGDDELDATLANIDLADFVPLAPEGLAGLGGHADGAVVVRGDLDRDPRGRVSLRVRDGSFRDVHDVSGHVNLSLEDEGVVSDVRLELGELGGVVVEGPIALDPPDLIRAPGRALATLGLGALRGSARNLDLSLLTRLGLTETLPVQGRLSTEITLTGTPDAPGLERAVLVLDRFTAPNVDPLRAKLTLRYDGRTLVVPHGWLADGRGELLTFEAELPLSLDAPPADFAAFWALLQREPWSLRAEIPSRRLNELPAPLGPLLPPGFAGELSVQATGGPGGRRAEIAGAMIAVDAPQGTACAQDVRPRVTFRATLEGDRIAGNLAGFLDDDEPAATGTAVARLAIDEWISEGFTEVPNTDLRFTVHDADLSQIPFACAYGQGPLRATVSAKDILTDHPIVGAIIDLPALVVVEELDDDGDARLSAAYRVHARAGSSPEHDALTGCVILGRADVLPTAGESCREVDRARDGELIARVRIPVDWEDLSMTPVYRDGAPISSWADFRRVHAQPVLAFVPGIVSGDAVIDGQIEAVGSWDTLSLSGDLDLSEGNLQIEGLGQHLHDISGRLELHGDEALFPPGRPLRAEDSGGTLNVQGSVGLDGVVPRTADLLLQARSFPIRREGMVLAALSGTATVGGSIGDDVTRMTIRTQDFAVRLPEQSAATLQPLDLHSQVLVVGSERPAGGEVSREGYRIEVRIDASDQFWVRRNDFAALISARLDAQYSDPNFRVRGEAILQRGTFEIFGKRFELASGGSLRFGGGDDLDPVVNIDAQYDIPSGGTVTVHVGGTLSSPEVRFSSSETNDRAEIIALLISGGRRQSGATEQLAAQQAASFLTGLATGILTLGLREEFGDIIPVLAVESQGSGGTRIRVGVDANEIIPDFMREVVTGAYVEGFLTAAANETNAAGSSAGSGGVGGGVSIEFTFPENFLLRGSYVPIDNGGIDWLWEP